MSVPSTSAFKPTSVTGALVLADGSVFYGQGFGATGISVGEVCFNTSITGYQEILTDPSYAGQTIVFTFPHIGNVGTNFEDIETMTPAARGLITRTPPSAPANWRSTQPFEQWLKSHRLIGLAGIDTRKLTRLIRDKGAPNAALVHVADGQLDIDGACALAAAWPGLEGMDLAKEVTTRQSYGWDETPWELMEGYGRLEKPKYHVVVIDYGAKRNILRSLAGAGCKVTVVPADTGAEAILRHEPDGIFLSNGPGDPAATGLYAVPTLQTLLTTGLPIFGICLGHQLLALAIGAKTVKMARGHRGANHPVQNLETGQVEITSQNHGFCVLSESLPPEAKTTHLSLFDKSNEGFRLQGRPVFSVQYHPEASPGPQDSHYLFEQFAAALAARAASRV